MHGFSVFLESIKNSNFLSTKPVYLSLVNVSCSIKEEKKRNVSLGVVPPNTMSYSHMSCNSAAQMSQSSRDFSDYKIKFF